MSPIRICVVSDTHGLLRPQALAHLRKADRIVHAGDVGSVEVLEAIEALAPSTVVRGNCDRWWWAKRLPTTALLEISGFTIYVIHDRQELDLDPRAAEVAAVISGHSHKPSIESQDGIWYINPGSVGPRRFGLPISMAWLTVDHGSIASELVTLDEPQTQ